MYRQKGIKWDVTARAAPFCFISHNHFVHLLALEFIGTHPAPADVDERRSIIFRGFWINIRFIKTSSLGPVGSLEGEIILFPRVSYIIYDVCHIFSISMGLRTRGSTSVGKNVHNIEMDFQTCVCNGLLCNWRKCLMYLYSVEMPSSGAFKPNCVE